MVTPTISGYPRTDDKNPRRGGSLMTSAPSQLTPQAADRVSTKDPAGSEPERGLPLFVLGGEADPNPERGVSCTGELPAPSDPALVARSQRARPALGDRAFGLAHHCQRYHLTSQAPAPLNSSHQPPHT